MAERLAINQITMSTEEWTCKVQVVDKGHPRTNREGNKKYQLMVLQDEEETQIEATMYGADITHYEKEFVPFQTYLVSLAYVRESIKTYGTPLHHFTWTIDRGTIIEPVKEVIPPEPPLLPPTQLQIAPFDSFDYQAIGFEFDILALVINGSPPSYASNGNRIQEFIIIDYQKKPTKLTLWEEFIDIYGNKLLTYLKELQDYPVILAKKVAKPKSFSGLSNRFGITIHINPPYPQAIKLKTWSIEIKPLLDTYTTKSATSTGSLLFVPFEEHIVPIVDIQQQSMGQIFHVQAQLSISNENQRFYVLLCSECKQIFPRNWSQRRFYCTTCRRSTHLTPRCQFEITIQDDTGSATAMISDKIGEELLSLTATEIHDIRCIKKQPLPLISIQHRLLGKTLTVQIKKLFAKNQDTSSAKLFIMSIIEKDVPSNQPLSVTVPTTPENSKRKLKQIMIQEN